MNKNLIVLSGFGYIAKKLLKQLNNEQVLTLSRSAISHDNNKHQHLVIDLDQSNVIDLQNLNAEQVTIVYLVPPNNQLSKDHRLRNFLQSIKVIKAHIDKFILISTTAVYGDCNGDWVNEESPLSLQLDKASRRFQMEQDSSDFCRQNNIPLTILRVAGIYAKDKLPIKRLSEAKPVLKLSESPYSNRIHADDLSNIIFHSINEDHEGIFNCCDSCPSTMSEYFINLAKALNYPEPAQITFQQAKKEFSAQMMNYLSESRRISNKKLLSEFQITLRYPSLAEFISTIRR